MRIKLFGDKTVSLQFFQVVRYGSLMLIGILFTKLGLSREDIGVYETLIFISSAVGFWVSGNIQSMLSIYPVQEKNQKGPAYFNVFLILMTLSLICFLLVRIFKPELEALLSPGNEIPYLNLFSWYILLINPTFLIEYIYLIRKESKQIIFYGVIVHLVQILAVIIPIWKGYSLEYSIYGLIAVAAFRFLWLGALLVKFSMIKIDLPFLKQHSWVAAPLIITGFISGSEQYIDNIIISNHYDRPTFAIYRYGAKELPIALLLANALSNSFITKLNAENFKQSLAELKKRSTKLMHMMFPLTIILLLFSDVIFPVLFNEEFVQSAAIFNIYLLLLISRVVFPQTIVLAKKKSRTILTVAILEIGINLGLSLWLIQYFGILGVAYATVIAYLFDKIALIIYNWSILKVPPKSYISLGTFGLYSIVLLTAYYFSEIHSW